MEQSNRKSLECWDANEIDVGNYDWYTHSSLYHFINDITIVVADSLSLSRPLQSNMLDTIFVVQRKSSFRSRHVRTLVTDFSAIDDGQVFFYTRIRYIQFQTEHPAPPHRPTGTSISTRVSKWKCLCFHYTSMCLFVGDWILFELLDMERKFIFFCCGHTYIKYVDFVTDSPYDMNWYNNCYSVGDDAIWQPGTMVMSAVSPALRLDAVHCTCGRHALNYSDTHVTHVCVSSYTSCTQCCLSDVPWATATGVCDMV